MPVPEGVITTSEMWDQPEPVQEVMEAVEEELPKAEADDL